MWPVRVNLLNIQTSHEAQLEKKKIPIKKWAEDLNIFLQRHRCLKGVWKDTQNHYVCCAVASVMSDSLQPFGL